MSNSSAAAYPQTIPMEKPTAHADGRNESVVEKKRRNSRSSKLSTKMTSTSRMEQRQERSEGGVIEKGEGLGDETSLSFPPFCATCEKQFATSNANQLFCSEACRLCDSKLAANGTSMVQLD
ncbi:hypothetical protein BKA61DRAFT_603226 [Leptodontidium sp. MPI-SDFR-AT-0119]|nr:hypothetical protein BKA61DRAFT_603226 [Leptodontidium sp. MPI-SDFR-AT-0119]